MVILLIVGAFYLASRAAGGVHASNFRVGAVAGSTSQVQPIAGPQAKSIEVAHEQTAQALRLPGGVTSALTSTQAALVAQARTITGAGSAQINALDVDKIAPSDLKVVEAATGANLAMLKYGYRVSIPWLR